MFFIARQKVVRQVWVFSQYSLKMTTKWPANLFVPPLKECTVWKLYWWRFRSPWGCTEHSCQTSLTLERACLQIASDSGRRTPTLGQCCRMCELKISDQVAFSHETRHGLTHRLTVFGDGLHVGLLQGEIHAQSVSEQTVPKHTHTHTPSVTPHLSMSTNFKGRSLL